MTRKQLEPTDHSGIFRDPCDHRTPYVVCFEVTNIEGTKLLHASRFDDYFDALTYSDRMTRRLKLVDREIIYPTATERKAAAKRKLAESTTSSK
jgi:hypothetical protein